MSERAYEERLRAKGPERPVVQGMPVCLDCCAPAWHCDCPRGYAWRDSAGNVQRTAPQEEP